MLLNSLARSVTDGIIFLIDCISEWQLCSQKRYSGGKLVHDLHANGFASKHGGPTWFWELWRFGTDKCDKMTMPKNCIQIDLKTDDREFWMKMTLKCDILIADQVWILILVVGPPNILVSNSSLVIFNYPLNSNNLEPNSILCSTGIIQTVKRRLMD